MLKRKIFCLIILFLFSLNTAQAGILFSKSNGISLTGMDGVSLTGMDGVSLTGADGFLAYKSNGISLTGADGVILTGLDGVSLTGADGVTYIGKNGVTLIGADGVSLTGADGATLTGADGVTLTGADGTIYRADSIKIVRPNGVSLTGADGITLTGADGVTLIGADGLTLTGADGVTLTGADGVTLTGADSITGFDTNGVLFSLVNPQGVTLTGADSLNFTDVEGITIVGARGITFTGADDQIDNNTRQGMNSIDPELALLLNRVTDDSNVNAVIVFHNLPDETDLNSLRQVGILGGTRFKVLPMIIVTATRRQLIAVSRFSNVRSIYGNRTLNLNSDPFFKNTGIQKVAPDRDLQNKNNGMPVSGRNITVAVLDTGVNSFHNDLAGKIIQNVKLADLQSLPLGFANPIPIENVTNTDLLSGHGTFVSGIIAASGISSGGKYSGVAPGAKILGLSAGDFNLFHVLSGFDYILERGANYNVRVVNCSFSANTVFDYNDPVNIATKMLTDQGINVVVSAGNSGSGNGSLNPYAAAPWVVSVGATDEKGRLADFSSRGVFGSQNQRPTIVATGVNVVSLRALGTQIGTLGVAGADLQRLTLGELPFYTTASGTSFSAPQVAGAIALMLETNPDLTPAEVKDILQRTATPLPEHFSHEVGAGTLNTYASVLESAFPTRKMGLYRSILDNKSIKFKNSVAYNFEETINPGSARVNQFTIAEDTIQAGINIAWEIGLNDLSLKLYDSQSNLVGNSNSLNLPGLTGTSEKISLNNPSSQNYRAVVQHSNNIGTSQRYFGKIETTQVEFSGISDLETISPQMQSVVKESLRKFLVSTQGSKFNPNFSVTRSELAESLLISGRVMQYVAGSPIFPDVRNLTLRTAVESVQSDKLFYDATNGSNFRPNNSASKLITAVALVKSAGLESQTSSARLPSNVTDTSIIPRQYRGFVALALQKGFVTLDGNKFNPNRALTRLELSLGMVNLVHFANQ